MKSLMLSRVSVFWLLLMVATCISWALAEGRVLSSSAVVVIIIIAAIKIRLVFLYFMEVNNMPLLWRLAFESWICVVTTVILLGYWYGRA